MNRVELVHMIALASDSKEHLPLCQNPPGIVGVGNIYIHMLLPKILSWKYSHFFWFWNAKVQILLYDPLLSHVGQNMMLYIIIPHTLLA